MAISRMKAKSLCTASELALVDASSPNRILSLSATQLRQKVARARRLLNKWRDNTKNQRRTMQAKLSSSGTGVAARSAEKARIFAVLLQRFEKRLAKMGSKLTKTTTSSKRLPRKTRSRQHRATRATVRRKLANARREFFKQG